MNSFEEGALSGLMASLRERRANPDAQYCVLPHLHTRECCKADKGLRPSLPPFPLRPVLQPVRLSPTPELPEVGTSSSQYFAKLEVRKPGEPLFVGLGQPFRSEKVDCESPESISTDFSGLAEFLNKTRATWGLPGLPVDQRIESRLSVGKLYEFIDNTAVYYICRFRNFIRIYKVSLKMSCAQKRSMKYSRMCNSPKRRGQILSRIKAMSTSVVYKDAEIGIAYEDLTRMQGPPHIIIDGPFNDNRSFLWNHFPFFHHEYGNNSRLLKL
jgi:hypothetical protein